MQQQGMLNLRQLADIRGCFEVGNVGMPPDRTRRRAGRIEHDGVERQIGQPGHCVGDDGLGLQAETLEVAAEPLHPRLGNIRLVAQPARLSRTPAALKTATPELGQHTDEVLADLGFSPKEILLLKEQGVI